MPVVHVRTLPPPQPQFDAQAAAEAVRAELADATGIETQHVTVTWTHTDASVGGDYRALAEVLAPDFHPPERVEAMIRAVAAALEREAGGPVFVEFRHARSGLVYDDGDVVRW